MASNKEVETDLSPVIKVYKDGTVERLLKLPHVPPSPEDPKTGVQSKDIAITPDISARLYLPKFSEITQKLPIFVYFHGGGFCLGSAFASNYHAYLNSIVSQAKALAVSIEYRRAPEHPLPTAYEDSWTALKWVVSHKNQEKHTQEEEQWINNFGDFDRVYIGGDSAGGNIVHNIAMRAGNECLPAEVKILGAFNSHPYFLGSKPVGSDPVENHDQGISYKLWKFVYPSAPGGFDNVTINPFAEDGPELSQLGCSRLLVCASEKDELRDRNIMYYEAVKASGWGGEVELIDVEGEGHCFHLQDLENEKAKSLVRRVSAFIK